MSEQKERVRWLIAAVAIVAVANGIGAAEAAKVPQAVSALASVTHRAVPQSGGFSWSAEYTYDGSGNITDISGQPLRYDVNGRLAQASVLSPTGAVTTQSFSYDAYGNMTSRPWGGSSTTITVDTTTNHLTSFSAVYDPAGSGNLTSYHSPNTGAVYNYVYDGFGMLSTEAVGSTMVTYNVYTADDERIWTYDNTTLNSVATVRDLSGQVLTRFERNYVGVVNGQATWRKDVTRNYVYGDGGRMVMALIPTTGGSEHFTLDHLGTPRVVTDWDGTTAHKVGYHVYAPFGEEITGTQEGEQKKFTGHERDRDIAADGTALDYMHARYYSPLLGRFLSRDAHAANTRFPESFNRCLRLE